VRDARAEPAALAQSVSSIRAEVHGRGQSVAHADPHHLLGGPEDELVRQVGVILVSKPLEHGATCHTD
jgi:hypothetical protein